MLEAACASGAAENATNDILHSLSQFRDFDRGSDFIDYNRAFHSAVAQASGNRRMAVATCDLIDQSERLVRVSLASIKGRDPTQLVAEHVALIEAIQQRDAKRAARLAREHVSQAERRVLSALARSAVVS
ncbi:MAG: FCD domain-containing protein [Aliidongia sp.]